MAVFKYNGYYGEYHYDAENDCWRGRVLYIEDNIPFEAKDATGLMKAFENAVDDYILRNIPKPKAIALQDTKNPNTIIIDPEV
jgi:predicted HicB family RNase H-like nuclease